jgi:ribosomal protein S18 acetylase RimI-like enzyme
MSQKTFVIRDRVTVEDIQNIKEIVETTGFFHSYETDVALELAHEYLAKGVKSGYYFLFAEDKGRTAGYCCYGPIACTEGSYDLYWIVVHRDYQGQGVGKALLKEAEQRIAAEGGRGIYVETASRPQYAPTHEFYKKSGYSIEAVLKDFYSPGDDKLVFVKKIAAIKIRREDTRMDAKKR